MNWLTGLFLLAVAALLGLAVAMRLVPSDPARWHAMPEGLEQGDSMASAVRVIEADERVLETLDAIARAHPGTELLAGSVGSGMMTYVTRSRVFGFPDYTTVALRDEGRIVLYARSRFGKSDLGVNAARLEDWLARLDQRG